MRCVDWEAGSCCCSVKSGVVLTAASFSRNMDGWMEQSLKRGVESSGR
jgi:hypothetical protein